MMKKIILLLSIPTFLGLGCKTIKESSVITSSQKERSIDSSSSSILDTNLVIPGASTSITLEAIVDTTADSCVTAGVLKPVEDSLVWTQSSPEVEKYTKTENRATATVTKKGNKYTFECDCADTVAQVRKYYESYYKSVANLSDSTSVSTKDTEHIVYKTPLYKNILAGIGVLSVTFIAFRAYKTIKPI